MTARPSTSLIRLTACLVAAFALVACAAGTSQSGAPSSSSAGSSSAPASASASGSTAPASGSAAPTSGLEGTLWQLSEYVGPDGNTVPVPTALAASATFADAIVSGNAGCNDYTAGFSVDGDKLTIGAVATTRKACGPVATGLETAYLAALGRVATFAATDSSLELRTAEGKVGLKFVPAKTASLNGTRWVATSLNNGTGGVTTIVPGTSLTATFVELGTVGGSGGCNTYSGSFTTDGTTIKIGPLAATMKLCGSPAGVDTQETQFFAAMQKATKYAISGTKLELRDDAGALLVAFQPTLGGA